MRVIVMPRAMASLRRIARRWRDTARVPEVLDDELTGVLQRIAEAPTSAPVARRSSRRTVYRVSARKTKLHLYYVVDDAQAVVKVIEVWSMHRAGPPRL